MISSRFFYERLVANGFEFFSGVPDSLLKGFCAVVTQKTRGDRHVIAANEGGAVALAAGYHLASGGLPVVYLQNSGIGNATNPLLSLMDELVFGIPVLLVIGWRGEPGRPDEPQHARQGEVIEAQIAAMGIGHARLADDEGAVSRQVADVARRLRETSAPYALLVRRGVLDDVENSLETGNHHVLAREQAIEAIVDGAGLDDLVVATTGMISRELFELRVRREQGHQRDFLTVGSMGHASQIAFGIALTAPGRRVLCLDGDGAFLMHMGGAAIIGAHGGRNLRHVVLNNGAHDSVGGQPTVAGQVDLVAIARACGYRYVASADDARSLDGAVGAFFAADGPTFLEVKVRLGARPNLGRPTVSPLENKREFIANLRNQV